MTQPAPAAKGTPARPGIHRRLYNWVLHWAYTPYALPALILLAFAESSFFPIPPDVLLLPLCLGEPKKAFRFAFWCSAASVLGGLAGYGIGYGLWNAGLDQFFYTYVPGFTEAKFATMSNWYEEYNFLVVFIAGFSPLPYKVFTIAAGVCGINVALFLLASLVSRSARFYIEAVLLRAYGAPIRDFVEKRLGLLAGLFCILLIGGFFAVKYLM